MFIARRITSNNLYFKQFILKKSSFLFVRFFCCSNFPSKFKLAATATSNVSAVLVPRTRNFVRVGAGAAAAGRGSAAGGVRSGWCGGERGGCAELARAACAGCAERARARGAKPSGRAGAVRGPLPAAAARVTSCPPASSSALAARTCCSSPLPRPSLNPARSYCRSQSPRPAFSCPTAPSIGAAPASVGWPLDRAVHSSGRPSPASTIVKRSQRAVSAMKSSAQCRSV